MDVWATGCIFAEMLGRRPLFPGHDYLHQLKIIMEVVGSPTPDANLDYITNAKAKRFITRQAPCPKLSFSKLYPKATSSSLDLLDKMLTFDPRDRVSIEQALEHEYFINVRDKSVEITCPIPFDFDFEKVDLTQEKLKNLVFEDICSFHPEVLEDEDPDGVHHIV